MKAKKWCLLIFVLVTARAYASWSMYGHDLCHTGFSSLTGTLSEIEVRWSYQTGDKVNASAAIVDVDGDTLPEVFIASDNGTFYAFNGEDGSIFWTYSINDTIGLGAQSSPAVSNIDGSAEPNMEVVIGSFDGRVYALNTENGSLLWSFLSQADDPIVCSPVIADVGEGGAQDVEVIFGGYSSHKLFVLNGNNGSCLWSYALTGYVYTSPAVADIDNDSKPEIVIGTGATTSLNIFAFNGENGSVLWSYQAGSIVYGTAAIGDIDNNGATDLEVVMTSADEKIYAFNGEDGSLLWSYNTGVMFGPGGCALANLDTDTTLEVIAGGAGVWALNGENGSLLWSYEPANLSYGRTAVADIDGDGKNEVVVSSKEPDYSLYALNGEDGSVLWSYTAAYYFYSSSPALEDLDNDNGLEIVVGSWDGKVYALDNNIGKVEEKHNTAQVLSLSQNIPNPFTQRTVISYSLNENRNDYTISDLRLTICDLSGRVVKSFSLIPKAFGTVTWDGKDNSGNRVNPGIYFYTLETNGISASKKLVILR